MLPDLHNYVAHPLPCVRDTRRRIIRMMSKLTLSVDEKVVERAKRYAEKRGTSVSRLVERFLDLLAQPPGESEDPPVLRRLRGILRQGASEDYRRHLVRKYR